MLFLNFRRDDHHDDDHDDKGGLHRDLLETGVAMGRRRMLRTTARLGVALGAIPLLGCAGDDSITGSDTNGTTGTDTTGGSANCVAKIPEETAGPFPGDGSNGPNALRTTGVVRNDIRSSFGGLSGSASGVLLNLELTIVSAASCSPLSDYAVYLWHCDAAGNYSLYSSGFTNQNFLRGVQAADANGKVKFTSIFPGCYSGRWPHIHFEVYQDVATAVASGPIVKTSQIALPAETDDAVYATSGYEQSVRNLAQTSLQRDMVFSDDGAIHQIATMSGSVADGYTASLTIGV